MEHVALTDQQLTYLAREDPKLKPKFYGVVPCDGLPKSPVKDMTKPKGYIVNTDPHDQPGQHWIALWTQGNVLSDGQLRPTLGLLPSSRSLERLGDETLEVHGEQWKVPSRNSQ